MEAIKEDFSKWGHSEHQIRTQAIVLRDWAFGNLVICFNSIICKVQDLCDSCLIRKVSLSQGQVRAAKQEVGSKAGRDPNLEEVGVKCIKVKGHQR